MSATHQGSPNRTSDAGAGQHQKPAPAPSDRNEHRQNTPASGQASLPPKAVPPAPDAQSETPLSKAQGRLEAGISTGRHRRPADLPAPSATRQPPGTTPSRHCRTADTAAPPVRGAGNAAAPPAQPRTWDTAGLRSTATAVPSLTAVAAARGHSGVVQLRGIR